MNPPTDRYIIVALLLAALIGIALYWSAADKSNTAPDPAAEKPVAVAVATVTQATVPFRLEAVGTVEAFASVAVKSRVNGRIVALPFDEGKAAKQGAVLFRLDPRPFEAALQQAEANALRDEAARDHAIAQDKRYKEMLAKNFVATDFYAQVHARARAAAAEAKASRAALEIARLDLEYCTITSPIDGFTGRALLQIGNEVKANDEKPLLVINQVQPIHIGFAVPEQQLDTVRAFHAKSPLQVTVHASNSVEPIAEGKLEFIDNAVDTATGMIRMRAQFDNTNLALWPGQFVAVSITLFQRDSALLIPSRAIQNGQAGQFVYVVKPDRTVAMRPVEVSQTAGDLAVITKGLALGETVTTRGMLRLFPGAIIEVLPEATSP